MKKIAVRLSVVVACSVIFHSALFAARLSDDDLAKKNEGWYPTGLPLVNFSSDDGFGYGVRGYIYNNGKRGDRYFESAPYFMQLYVQYFATTNGVQYHEINLDMPYVAGTRFRLKTAAVYNKELNANYFGRGAEAAQMDLVNPADPSTTYETWNDYFEYIDDHKEHYKYNNFTITKPKYYVYLFRDLTDSIKLMAGAEFQKVDIEAWDGRRFDGHDQEATRLTQEANAGGIIGFDGGWTNYARFSVAYDTRDFEPDPRNGVYLDYCFEVSEGFMGSEYDFLKHNVGARSYISLAGSLVLAMRLGYTTATGDIPFYEMNFFGFSQSRQEGLGANRTLRGYKKNRFAGPTMTVGNAELRWQFAEVTGWDQRFGFQLLGFCDAGNVYDHASDPFDDPRLDDYHTAYGGGIVIAWNLSTIVHFLYGMSKEDSTISVDFEHAF